MNNRFVLILAACIVGFFGIILMTKKDTATNNTSGGQMTNHMVEGTSGVTLIEYGDFECPACYRFFPIVEEVREKYKGKLTFQFRHFPLVEIHQNALVAARAAEAADKQGKFWEMYNVLYTAQQEWSKLTDPTATFESYAKQIGLNVDQFKNDMKSEEINSLVQADRNEAKRLGFTSTPTFVLDGQQLTDARDTVEYFSQKIDEAIANKQKNDQ